MKVKILYHRSYVILATFALFAQSVMASDFHSPRTSALGGAGHAGPLLNDSIYLNPSFVSFLPVYSLSGNYQFYHDPATSQTRRNWGVSLQDGRTELFQAGVGIARRLPYTLIHFGAAKAVVDRLGFGLGAKYIMKDSYRNSAQDASFSVSGVVMRWFQAALIVDNLLETNLGKSVQMYREVILGTKFNVMEIVMVYLDPHVMPTLKGSSSYGHEAGLEFTVFSDFYLRVGSFRNSLQPAISRLGRGWGIGGGWIGPKLSIDYGLSHISSPINTTAHNAGLTLYF